MSPPWHCKHLVRVLYAYGLVRVLLSESYIKHWALHLVGASQFVIRFTGTFILAFIASIRERAPDCARMTYHYFSFLCVRMKTNAVTE